ncbi:MAG: ExbD/TolR family protein [Cellvibrionaceae bacterium]
MKRNRHKKFREEKDLDITSFMNLMIVLVPVLLMNMVFSQITVLDLKLPDSAASSESVEENENQQLELVIHDDYMDLNFPAGIRLKRIEKKEDDYDYKMLSLILQEVKRQLRDKDIDKKDILVLSQPNTDYQTLVSVMDTVRSFQAIVAASVVDAELFPDISLGDAPVNETASESQRLKENSIAAISSTAINGGVMQ